jgi:hypothetical protein
MKKRKLKRDWDRIGHYFWIRDNFGLEDAAAFFPDIHARFHSTPEVKDTGAEDKPQELGEKDGY